MAISTDSVKGKQGDAGDGGAAAEVAAGKATAADLAAEAKAEPEDDAARAEREPDPRLDSRSKAERTAVVDRSIVAQHVNGPDLAGQAEYTKKYLDGLKKDAK